jgi:hypothetical protein
MVDLARIGNEAPLATSVLMMGATWSGGRGGGGLLGLRNAAGAGAAVGMASAAAAAAPGRQALWRPRGQQPGGAATGLLLAGCCSPPAPPAAAAAASGPATTPAMPCRALAGRRSRSQGRQQQALRSLPACCLLPTMGGRQQQPAQLQRQLLYYCYTGLTQPIRLMARK